MAPSLCRKGADMCAEVAYVGDEVGADIQDAQRGVVCAVKAREGGQPAPGQAQRRQPGQARKHAVRHCCHGGDACHSQEPSDVIQCSFLFSGVPVTNVLCRLTN